MELGYILAEGNLPLNQHQRPTPLLRRNIPNLMPSMQCTNCKSSCSNNFDGVLIIATGLLRGIKLINTYMQLICLYFFNYIFISLIPHRTILSNVPNEISKIKILFVFMSLFCQSRN